MEVPKRVLIAGGGTAGHVYPGLALAHTLGGRGHHIEFAGTERGLEASLVRSNGYPFHRVEARPLARKPSPAAVRAALTAARAIGACRPVVRAFDAVVGMGGYVSVAPVLAARRERVPVVLHEQNAVPGLANRVLARASQVVAVAFPEAVASFRHGVATVLTGNPVREEILRVPEDRETLAKEAMDRFDLDPERRSVVVFGGSQGALHLDQAAAGACFLLHHRADLQVVMITGPAHLGAVKQALPSPAARIEVRLLGYLDRMELAYACADVVVSRAGATSVAEVSVCGLPSLLVPYPHATGRHQEANARALQRAGGASLLPDGQLSAEGLAERIEGLVDHPERLHAMAERSRAFGKPDAALRLADLVEEVAR